MVNKKKQPNQQQSVKKGQDKSADKNAGSASTNNEKNSAKDRNESSSKDDSKAATSFVSGDKSKRPRAEESEGIVVQSSGRISKKPKWDYDPYSPPKRSGTTKKTGPKQNVNKTPVEPRKRGGREISVWTTHDKNNFFEGLKEHGRDWKALHLYLKKHNRGVTKNIAEKTPEHIRQFYYRAWHKVAKYLKCPEGVDRQALEIFGLICYGEFRKKIGFYNMDPAMGEKLNEMVFKGVTFIRHRKPGTRKITNYNIKTPHCTMLEKLNNLEGIKLHQRRPTAIKLPREIVVELRPRTNDTWATVQAISQNPRIKTKVDPEKRLSSFIDYMNKKWKSLRLRLKENMNEKEKPEREIKIYAPPNQTLMPWDVTRLKPNKTNPDVQRSLGFETYMRILENMSSPTVPKAGRRSALKSQNNEQKESKTETADNLLSAKSDLSNSKGSVDTGNTKSNSKHSRGSVKQRQNSKSIDNLDIKPVLLHEHPFSVLGTSNENSTKGSSTNDSTRTDPKSDFSSSPESRTKVIKREAVDSRSNPTVDKTTSAVVEDENNEANQEVLAKLDTVRAGMNRTAAETITVSDVYLMMGMPDKVVLEYEWVDLIKKPDYLNLGDLANMLRRLIDLARTETTEFGKSKSVQQALKQEDGGIACTCGAYKLNTPPNSKRGSRRTKPGTPRGPKKALPTSNGPVGDFVGSPTSSQIKVPGSPSSTLIKGYPPGAVMSPPGAVISAEPKGVPKPQPVQVPAHISPSNGFFPHVSYVIRPPNGNLPRPTFNQFSRFPHGVFKVPVSAAPRPPQTSPITINNIAQKLSHTDLMEHINQANKHTDIFLPRRRQKKSRLRRPMIIQRRILPKPFLNTPNYSRDGAFGPPQQTIKSAPNGQVMKVMNPSDVRSVTVKSVIGPEHHLQQMQMLRGSTITSITPLSSQTVVSPKTHGINASCRSETVCKPQAGHNEQVPVVPLQSFLAVNNYAQNSEVPTAKRKTDTPVSSNASIISQAALATGIPVDLMPDSTDGFHGNGDNGLLTLKSNVPGSSSLNNTIGSLLDISLPAVPDDTTDKMLDLALANSNSTFSVSALLEAAGKGSDNSSHKDTSQDFSRLTSPSQLSPSKLFKNISAGSEESWLGGEDFNLSSFLSDSPIKKPTTGSTSSQVNKGINIPSSHVPTAMSSMSLINEGSRDSVIGKGFDFSVVDGTLKSMMNENSLDYMSNFADLAREIEKEEKQKALTS